MAIEVVSEFIAKATVRTRAYIYDDDGDLVDPTSANVEIINPSGGTAVASTAMSNPSTGIYEHYYYTASTTTQGWYRSRVEVIDGSGDTAKYSINEVSFRVK